MNSPFSMHTKLSSSNPSCKDGISILLNVARIPFFGTLRSLLSLRSRQSASLLCRKYPTTRKSLCFPGTIYLDLSAFVGFVLSMTQSLLLSIQYWRTSASLRQVLSISRLICSNPLSANSRAKKVLLPDPCRPISMTMVDLGSHSSHPSSLYQNLTAP